MCVWRSTLNLFIVDAPDALDHRGERRGVAVPELLEVVRVEIRDLGVGLVDGPLELGILHRLPNRIAQRLDDRGWRALRHEQAGPEVVLDVVAELLQRRRRG